FWREAAPVGALPPQEAPKPVAVAAAGAGDAGLPAALALARAGRAAVAVGRHAPGAGASPRHGGLASRDSTPDHAPRQRRFGPDRTMAIEREGKEARAFLYDFLREEGIDCDFQPVGRFNGALGTEDYDKLARNAEKLHRELG